MAHTTAHLEVVLDVDEPIALEDFVTAFTSVANQYRSYMKAEHPDLRDDCKVFVKDIRRGSIIADLVPAVASLISCMDQVNIVTEFVARCGNRLSQYFQLGGRAPDASKSELDSFMGQVAAIANARSGEGAIRAVAFEDGKREVRAAVIFDKKQAATATLEIEKHREELSRRSCCTHQRVLMVFKRSDKDHFAVGVRSGERVIIEQLNCGDLPLVYGSDLAEQKIKDQMRIQSENIFHKGFIVDVIVNKHSGRPVAYTVTDVHQIIDLVP